MQNWTLLADHAPAPTDTPAYTAAARLTHLAETYTSPLMDLPLLRQILAVNFPDHVDKLVTLWRRVYGLAQITPRDYYAPGWTEVRSLDRLCRAGVMRRASGTPGAKYFAKLPTQAALAKQHTRAKLRRAHRANRKAG